MKMRPSRLSSTLTFLASTAGLAFLILSRVIWVNDLPAGLIAAGLAAVLVVGWLAYRLTRKACLPRTGLAPVWLFGLAAAALSTAFSPDPRLAIERLAWLGGMVLLFYLLIDGLEGGLDRGALQDALLSIAGLLAALAGMETAAFYSGWWQIAGGPSQAPPYPYRVATFIGHANVYMAFMNLCAPLALVSLLTARTRARRFLSLLCLVFYAISIPFASSRGGFLGMLAWGGALTLAWISLKGWWRPLWTWVSRRWLLAVLAGAGGLLLLSAGAYRFYQVVLTNPSHGGGGLLDARGGIWAGALAVWQLQPWTGVGPGRFTQGWLEASRSVPPGFWAAHAHNIFLQALAEMGPLGLVSLLALLAWGGWKLWLAWKRTPPERIPWVLAGLAGLAGFLVHSLFDDFSTSPPILVALVMLVALVWRADAQPLARRSRISLGWLCLPVGLVFLPAAWSLWAGLPAFQAVGLAAQGRWQEAARGFDESTRRDPTFGFYFVQAGLAWDQVWQRTGDPADLQRAEAGFKAGLAREPGFSLLWADLAALEQQAGQVGLALENIDQASLRAPGEPKYLLNRAWLLEQAGRTAEAAQAYQAVINQAPDWASHPFWTGSGLRQEVLAGISAVGGGAPAYWQQAGQAVQAGRFGDARRLLAWSAMLGEPAEARGVMRARLDEAAGGMQEALPAYRDLRSLLAVPLLSPSAGPVIYNGFQNRLGLQNQLVSGFLNLSGDYGQFERLQRLYRYEHDNGQCDQAGQTWIVWHNAMQGFASSSTTSLPDCP